MTKMMLEIPETLKAMYAPLRELLDTVEAQVTRSRGAEREARYESFETRVVEKMTALERGAHEAALSALEVDEPRVLINGELHVRVLRTPTTYMSQAGEVSVTRSLFRRASERNGATVDLVALRAGAVADVWLPGAARDMAYLLQQGTSREAQATARELGRLPYSRSSFERVGHAVGAKFVGQHEHIEELLITAFEVPRSVRSLSVSLDRVSIPMEEPRLRPPGRPRKGAQSGRSRAFTAWRTAPPSRCTTLKAPRYIRSDTARCLMATRKAVAMGSRATCWRSQEAARAARLASLRRRGGDVELARRGVRPGDLPRRPHPSAGRLLAQRREARRRGARAGGCRGASALTARWKLALLDRSAARAAILRELIDSGKEDVRIGDERPVHNAITYLTNHASRMDYAYARRRHLPVGSGNVEATCKSLVGVRMKVTSRAVPS